MFFGYLIALAALIIYLVVQQVSPTGGIIVFLVLFLAIPWIIWRSLIFNMRVSSYSNVRFGFQGTLGTAYFNFFVLPLLMLIAIYGVPVTTAILSAGSGGEASFVGSIVVVAFLVGLGLAVYLYGVLQQRNNSYVINGSRFGQGKFMSVLQAGPFVKILLKTIVLFVICFFLLLVLMAFISMAMGSEVVALSAALNDPEAMEDIFTSGLFVSIIAAVYIGFILLSIGVFAYLQARQRRYIFANTTLDGKFKLASTMGARSLAWISISNLLVIMVTLGLAIPWASVRMARFVAQNTQVDTSEGFSNYVSQRQSEQSSLGDQLGDAFDIDVGIGL